MIRYTKRGPGHGDTKSEYISACGIAAEHYKSGGGTGVLPIGGQCADSPAGAGAGHAAV